MSKQLLFSARRKDFKIDTFAAGGPGGQHQNKTQSAVRITHIETGLSATARESKSQHQNLKAAFRRLAQLLIRHVVGEKQKERFASGHEVIRTYHGPDNRVTDKSTGLQLPYDDVLSGKGLDVIIRERNSLAD